MTTSSALSDLGWAPFFQTQLDQDEVTTATTPCRISAVHRNRLEAIDEKGQLSLVPPSGLSTGEIAVGDWALSDGQRLLRLLHRRTCLARRAAGTGAARQLIAANVDTLFIVTSCNADFNPARLERYLALAIGAGVEPVILLTKTDLCEDPEVWRERAAAVSRPITDALKPWLAEKLSLISQKTKLAEAIRYALSRWQGLTRFIDDGRIEIDSNIVERSIRPIALNRKNALFAGSDGGGEHWAVIASLIETAKLNAVDPQAYLADVLTRIVNGHPQGLGHGGAG